MLTQVLRESTKLHGAPEAAAPCGAAVLIRPRLAAEPARAGDTVHIPAVIAKTTIANRPLDLTKRLSIGPPTVPLQKKANNTIF